MITKTIASVLKTTKSGNTNRSVILDVSLVIFNQGVKYNVN